jgi:hypothetical protein
MGRPDTEGDWDGDRDCDEVSDWVTLGDGEKLAVGDCVCDNDVLGTCDVVREPDTLCVCVCEAVAAWLGVRDKVELMLAVCVAVDSWLGDTELDRDCVWVGDGLQTIFAADRATPGYVPRGSHVVPSGDVSESTATPKTPLGGSVMLPGAAMKFQ